MEHWYSHPLDLRAPKGGEEEFGKLYKGGEFMPFYIPRRDMPQIEVSDYPDLQLFLKARGVGFLYTEVLEPRVLHAHQRIIFASGEFHGDIHEPILSSKDRYILDGNHRWKAHVLQGLKISSFTVELPFEPAIELLFQFPKTTVTRSIHPGE